MAAPKGRATPRHLDLPHDKSRATRLVAARRLNSWMLCKSAANLPMKLRFIRIVAAILLALPLLFFGGAFFMYPSAMTLPPANGQPGIALLHAIREGGLTNAIAFSHVVCGLLLLIPWTRFLGAILQLPMTIGIVAFHAFMWRLGLPLPILMLVLNLIVLWEPARLRALVGRVPKPAKQQLETKTPEKSK